MNRRTFLQASSLLTASHLLGKNLKPINKTLLPAQKNLVVIVSGLGFNPHAFKVSGDNLSSSPLIAQLKDHHNDLLEIELRLLEYFFFFQLYLSLWKQSHLRDLVEIQSTLNK